MNRTKREMLIAKLKKFSKKNRIYKWLAMIAMYVVVGFCAIIQYFAGNGKRFCGIITVWLFFVVSCSFSLPGFVEVTEVVAAEQEVSTNPTEDSLINQILSGEETAVIDDNDVLEGYEDSDLSSPSVDTFTVDEILKEESGLTQTLLEENQAQTGKEQEDELYQANGTNQNGENSVILNKEDWRLVLINKQHPVPEDYTVELGSLTNNMKCDKRIIGDLLQMMQDAKEDGINLVICSPYRDYNRQEVLFERKIKAYMAKGLSYMEAYMVSSQAVTVPGASEHQIGMALDIVCNSYLSLDDGFGETQAGKWLYENGYRYGFIQRYPKGKEHITGIMYEPWHYRYVGKDAAAVIKNQNITLEELVEGL